MQARPIGVDFLVRLRARKEIPSYSSFAVSSLFNTKLLKIKYFLLGIFLLVKNNNRLNLFKLAPRNGHMKHVTHSHS